MYINWHHCYYILNHIALSSEIYREILSEKKRNARWYRIKMYYAYQLSNAFPPKYCSWTIFLYSEKGKRKNIMENLLPVQLSFISQQKMFVDWNLKEIPHFANSNVANCDNRFPWKSECKWSLRYQE